MSGIAPALSVDIIHELSGWRAIVEDTALAAAARAACKSAACPDQPSGVALLLTGDAQVRQLNGAWRGRDEATNVLSFPHDGPVAHRGRCHLGDIALALETVTREAAQKSIPAGHHAAHLVVHGMLHLLGYDHEKDAQAQAMEALETKILLGLGLPDPYAQDTMPAGEAR